MPLLITMLRPSTLLISVLNKKELVRFLLRSEESLVGLLDFVSYSNSC